MRFVFAALSSVTGLIGLVFVIEGGTFAGGLDLFDSSAIQVTQVYTQAAHRVMVGIGVIGLAILIAAIGLLFPARSASTGRDD